MLKKVVEDLGKEEVSSIELLKWFRDRSDKFSCLSCNKKFKDVVWFIDTRPGDDIVIKEKGKQSVIVVCCNCGKENPLSELIKQLE